jgi:hypothetical protein
VRMLPVPSAATVEAVEADIQAGRVILCLGVSEYF